MHRYNGTLTLKKLYDATICCNVDGPRDDLTKSLNINASCQLQSDFITHQVLCL